MTYVFKISRRILNLFFLMFTSVGSGQEIREGEHYLIGKKAPDFTAQTLSGKKFNLIDYQGRPVILNFWHTTCRWCILELPGYSRLMDEHKDLVVVSLTRNSKEELGDFLVCEDEEYKLAKTDLEGTRLPFIIIPDANPVVDLYMNQNLGYPLTFFIDRTGKVKDFTMGYTLNSNDFDNLREFNHRANYEFLKAKVSIIIH